MSELKTLSPKNDYKLPDNSYFNEIADSFIGLESIAEQGFKAFIPCTPV